jgi:hypothetical protein
MTQTAEENSSDGRFGLVFLRFVLVSDFGFLDFSRRAKIRG